MSKSIRLRIRFDDDREFEFRVGNPPTEGVHRWHWMFHELPPRPGVKGHGTPNRWRRMEGAAGDGLAALVAYHAETDDPAAVERPNDEAPA